MYQPTFDGCWAKIDRAEVHREALKEYVRGAFAVEDHCPRLSAKIDPESGEHVYYISHMPDLTYVLMRASVIFGDAVHNLRSALDHLVFQLALRHTGGNVVNETAVQFPIVTDAAKWAGQRKQRLGEVSPTDAAVIEGLQPYHALDRDGVPIPEHDPLAVLNTLSNMDKHRLLITTVVRADALAVSGPRTMWAFFRPGARFRGSVPLELGAELVRHPAFDPQRPAVEMESRVTPTIALPDGRFAINALENMETVVVKAVDLFDPTP